MFGGAWRSSTWSPDVVDPIVKISVADPMSPRSDRSCAGPAGPAACLIVDGDGSKGLFELRLDVEEARDRWPVGRRTQIVDQVVFREFVVM